MAAGHSIKEIGLIARWVKKVWHVDNQLFEVFQFLEKGLPIAACVYMTFYWVNDYFVF